MAKTNHTASSRRILSGTAWVLALGYAAALATATAADFDQGAVFTLIEENDLVVDTDRHYTQGIKVAYLHDDGAMPQWVHGLSDWLPSVAYSPRVARIGFELGQNIYTPADTHTTDPIPKDRPYAGWLYAGFTLQRRGFTADIWPTLESFELQLGIIGPESLAKEAQTWVHEIRGFDLPQGWANQLNTEPGVALRYWRGLRLSPSDAVSHYFDVIPHVGASLGNVETSFRVGGTARLGVNLPDSFGVQTISSLVTTEGGWSPGRPGSQWGIHGFSGFEGWLVAHTVFLDGNLWQHSQSVPRETTVIEWKSGVALTFRHAELALAYVYRSREFEGQELSNGYGSLSMKIRL